MSSPPPSSPPRKKRKSDAGNTDSAPYDPTDLSEGMSSVSEPHPMSLDEDNPSGLAAQLPMFAHSSDGESEADLDRTPRAQHFDLPALDEVPDRDEHVSGTSSSLAEAEPDSSIRPEPVDGSRHQTAEDETITEDPGIKLYNDLRGQPDRIKKWLSALGIISTVEIRNTADAISGIGTVKKRANVTLVTELPNGETKAAHEVTQKDLELHGRWEFVVVSRHDPESEPLTAHVRNWGKMPCKNICMPPEKDMHTNNKEYYLLERKIGLALRIERGELEKAVLFLPEKWKLTAEGKPPSYIPLPYPYCGVLYQEMPESDNKSEVLQSGREAASSSEVSDDITADENSDTETVRSHTDRDSQDVRMAPISADGLEGGIDQESQDAVWTLPSQPSRDEESEEGTKSHGTRPGLNDDSVDKTSGYQPLTDNAILLRNLSDEERLELDGLLRDHPFPGETATREQQREAAIALQSKLDRRNLHYDEYQLTKQLVGRLCGAKDVVGCVEWVKTKKLKKMIRKSGVGDPFINEGVKYGEASSQRVINLFITQLGGFKDDSEGAVEKTSGFYLKGFVTGKGLVTRHNVPLPFPSYLRMFGSNPSPDIYSRIAEMLGWAPTLLPVLFAGECKRGVSHTKNTKAQLACAFHATLIILVLYYLDNRRSSTEALPPWLYLDAIDYVENGFLIYAHYPQYVYEPKPHWKFVSAQVTNAYAQVFQNPRTELSVRATATLLRLVTHTHFLLRKLTKWERAATVLKPLFEQAAWETKIGI